jgi:hypothetical protein
MGANKHIAYYTACYNTGGVDKFIISGGAGDLRFGCLSPEGTGQKDWTYFVSVEYMGARCSSGCTITFSNGTDVNGINNSLP